MNRVVRVPTRPCGEVCFPIRVDVSGRQTDVVKRGKFPGDHMLGPSWILIPDDDFLIDQ